MMEKATCFKCLQNAFLFRSPESVTAKHWLWPMGLQGWFLWVSSPQAIFQATRSEAPQKPSKVFSRFESLGFRVPTFCLQSILVGNPPPKKRIGKRAVLGRRRFLLNILPVLMVSLEKRGRPRNRQSSGDIRVFQYPPCGWSVGLWEPRTQFGLLLFVHFTRLSRLDLF